MIWGAKREHDGQQAEREAEHPRANRSVESADCDWSGFRGGMSRASQGCTTAFANG